MASNVKVVLFEDTAQTRSEVMRALERRLGEHGVVVAFDPAKLSESAAGSQRMYEERLETILGEEPYASATLIVADRDLSKSEGFAGLSVNAVEAAAKRLSIPICSYARRAQSEGDEWRRWEEEHIVLSGSRGDEELARQAAVAARGFGEIADALRGIEIDNRSSPAKILASILGKPEYAEKIALYSVGDKGRLPEVLGKAPGTQQVVARLTQFLGYWLWDSLMRYPGLLVNEIAAASHLNIDTADFNKPEVRRLFEDALYEGPFADQQTPHWWRGVLDDIVSREDCADGLELAQKTLKEPIGRSRCCVDESKPAGYYCIISRQPVSLENSKGGLSWFPRGADLTRISNPRFEEYGPWLGA